MAAKMSPQRNDTEFAGTGSESYRDESARNPSGQGGESEPGTSSGATGQDEVQNWGSARSDYGEHAYGGTLKEDGTGGAEVDEHSTTGGREIGNRTAFATDEGDYAVSGGSMGGGLAILAGIGIGAALMYFLDPDRGPRRRALLRDKLVSFTNTAGEAIESQARHLRNRAQGLAHEAGSLLSSRGSSADESASSDETRRSDETSVPGATTEQNG